MMAVSRIERRNGSGDSQDSEAEHVPLQEQIRELKRKLADLQRRVDALESSQTAS